MVRLLRQRGYRPILWLCIIDFCLSVVAGAVGLNLSWAQWPLWAYTPEILLFAAAAMVSSYACGLYRWRHVWSYADTAVRTAVAMLIAFAMLAIILYAFPGLTIYRSAVAVSFPILFVAFLITRRLFLLLLDRGLIRRRILVLGVGENATRLLRLEQGSRSRRFTLVGFVDVCGEQPCIAEERIVHLSGSLPELVSSLHADEILLAAGERRGSLPLPSLIECRLRGVQVTSYQVFCERELGRIDHDALRPDWFFTEGFLGGPWRMNLKRGLDVACSVLLLCVSWPLIVATGVAIGIESPGGILYRQERRGLRGRNFRLTKFRSMYQDAERDGPRWADEKDPRVTAIGRIIRTTRIDELPQLLNVLKGEMSFVGPRPERPYFVDQIGQSIRFYEERHYMKPGITGWAQLNYPYGASVLDAKRKLEYDLFYLKYFSIVLDLLIILQTLRIILWREGVR